MYMYLAVGIGGAIGALLRYFILIWFINLRILLPDWNALHKFNWVFYFRIFTGNCKSL